LIQQPELGTVGILKFINQNILIPFLIVSEKCLVIFEGLVHPQQHILVFIPAGLVERLLIDGKQIGCCLQAHHFFSNGGNLRQLGIPFFPVPAVYLINVGGVCRETAEEFIRLFQDKTGRPPLLFHVGKQVSYLRLIHIYIFPAASERMTDGKV
jgi:hypothetical protein